MGMSGLYGPADDAESVATIGAALEAGITLLDTGDYYRAGHNELLIRDALRGRDREDAVLSVKFGVLRSPGGEILGLDGRPAAVKNALGLHAHTAGHRPRRRLPPRPPRSGRSNRGDGGRDRGARGDGVRALRRPVRSRPGDDPARPRHAPRLRPADRVLARLARDRGRDPAYLPGVGDRHYRVWGALTRSDQRSLVAGATARCR